MQQFKLTSVIKVSTNIERKIIFALQQKDIDI
jgi:hypothetical protein